jgi:prepilin-type N-terminal cleavage/methylation domain-containing protein
MFPAAHAHLRNHRRGAPTRRRGVTLLEVLVVVGIIAIIAAILLPVLSKARAASQKITCLSNLRSIGIAFHLYAEHNTMRLPDPTTTRISWEASLLPYASSSVFKCPSDSEVFPALGSSYDWRDTPDPNSSLAGQNILLAQRSSLVLAFEALPGWHGKMRMNVCYLSDGSAHEMDYEAAMRDLDAPLTQSP